MDEITLRLPGETATALRSEADQRGVTVEDHLREIIDAYRADDDTRPGQTIEYLHAGSTAERESPDRTEEIGSFRYGSRSILSE